MVRKRPYCELQTWPDRLHVYSGCMDEMVKEQDAGNAYYGECFNDDNARTKRTQTFFTGTNYLHASMIPQQYPMQPLSYIPPQPDRITINNQEMHRTIASMTSETAISPEEARLVAEAQNLGWSWSKIAKVFQGRTAKQLMRLCMQPSKPRRSVARKESVAREDVRSRAAVETPSQPPPSSIAQSLALQIEQKKEKTPEKAESNPSSTTNPTSSNTGPEDVEEVVNSNALNRSGGDGRVTFRKPLKSPPEGFSGMEAHGLKSLDKVKFFEELEVVDPDDCSRVFRFKLEDPTHCACFNIGVGEDGSPLMSWSDLSYFYELPDGTKWVEHGYLYDLEDLELYAKKLGKDCKHLIPEDMGEQELIKKRGSYHSRVQNIEYECWIYYGRLPKNHGHGEDAYFYRNTFEPVTLEKVE
ncbi:hypothetical protein BSKO_01486 [Bryopsis sp. KO-2023]|nr:hypothetical protein BSKO_01486 [Bryopsis sp. KO-2023]